MKRKKRRYRLRYKKVTVWLSKNPRRGICRACGKSVKKKEIKKTDIHHYKYEFSMEQVKANPQLALRNTLELCFVHHRLADAVRVITYYNPLYMVELVDVLPKWITDKLISVYREV